MVICPIALFRYVGQLLKLSLSFYRISNKGYTQESSVDILVDAPKLLQHTSSEI